MSQPEKEDHGIGSPALENTLLGETQWCSLSS